MFQGSAFADAKNFREFGFDPTTIDAVIISHGHLDHIGRLPKLIKENFRGPIYATPPTAKIIKIVLEDAETVMEDDFKRSYRPKLFSKEDVAKTITKIKTADYSQKVKVGNLQFRFRDAGHIFGSAFIEIEEKDGARIVFSGDLGNKNVPILRPTAQIAENDFLIIESTYGDRLHEDESTRESKLKATLNASIKQKGVLLIPAFAVERTQELLYELNHLVENHLIPPVDIYLDSPMAIKISEVINQFPEYYSQEALRLVSAGDDFFVFPGLKTTKSRDDSKLINDAPRPKVIISGSGMMNGGRIQHHLVRYLGDSANTVLIIGYQSAGTLGRRLYSGDKRVDVLDVRVTVKAKILSIGAYSAHADQRRLLEWISSAKSKPKKIFCTHGEESASAALATRIQEELSIHTDVPRFEEAIKL